MIVETSRLSCDPPATGVVDRLHQLGFDYVLRYRDPYQPDCDYNDTGENPPIDYSFESFF